MTRQWVRVTSGKCAGRVGYIINDIGAVATIWFPDAIYPDDWVLKKAHTFERLSEAECAVMEMRPSKRQGVGG